MPTAEAIRPRSEPASLEAYHVRLDGQSRAPLGAAEPGFIRPEILALRESQIEQLWRLGCDVDDLIGTAVEYARRTDRAGPRLSRD
jgi:hypothetical protein